MITNGWDVETILDQMTGSLWTALCKRSMAHFRAEHGLEPEDERPAKDRYMTPEAWKAFVDTTGGQIPGVSAA